MYNFNEDAIREAAYYIWKNNGCPSNSSLNDWDAAIHQLSAHASIQLKAPKKASSTVKVLMPKKTVAKATTLRNVKSIILKPASALKTTAAKKAPAAKVAAKTTAKSTSKKTTTKKSK